MSINPVGFNQNIQGTSRASNKNQAIPVQDDSVQISGGAVKNDVFLDLGAKARKKGLLRFIGIGRMKPEEGMDGIMKMADAISQGKIDDKIFISNADNLEEQIKAVSRSKDESGTVSLVKDMYEYHKAWQKGWTEKPFDTERIGKVLSEKTGWKLKDQGSLYMNFEHHYDMNYDDQGRFRGTSVYNTEGKTHVMSAKIFQKEGGTEKDPAAILLNFERPAHTGLSFEDTPYNGRSSSNSLFFVEHLGDIESLQGLINTGEAVSSLNEATSNAKVMFKSLDSKSQFQLHDYTVGYGRVGTSRHSEIIVPGMKDDLSVKHQNLAGIAILAKLVKD